MDEELSNDEAVARFVLEVTKQRVAYLKFIKSKGYPVDEDQIAQFEQEVRDEEKRLNDSELVGQQDVVELQEQLAYVDLFDDESSSDYLKALLLKRQYTKVKMRPEQNHRRPHFHIEYKREHSASYAVDTLERLAGYMPKKYEEPVLEWAAQHQRSLAATWTSLLAGNDVRELVLVAPEP